VPIVDCGGPGAAPRRSLMGRLRPPPKARKTVLDPSVITAMRPQDIVREIVEKTGINRTKAQRLTATMAEDALSAPREAENLLRQGLTKNEVARQVGLSTSRISALFKGEKFARRRQR
jgi:DNA-binding NarL/FixJ family response regulator